MFSPKKKKKTTNKPRARARIPKSKQTQSHKSQTNLDTHLCKFQTNPDTHSWAMDSLLDACHSHHRRRSHFPSKHHPSLKPPTNQTHKLRKIIKTTQKNKPRNLKQTNTHMENTNPGQRDRDQHQLIYDLQAPIQRQSSACGDADSEARRSDL